jgi:hypothetical protein
MQGLPEPVLVQILGHLTLPDLLSTSLVCTSFLKASRSPILWKKIALSTFPTLRARPALKPVDLSWRRLTRNLWTYRATVERGFPVRKPFKGHLISVNAISIHKNELATVIKKHNNF